MSKAATTPADPTAPAPSPEQVRLQLRGILASPAFHGSKRCQQFLEYVCEQALTGRVGLLKERTVAIEVFGRQPESDLGEDTIVRVGAREVRKRLAQYYVTPEGSAAEVRIDLPPGSYAPEFRYAVALREAPREIVPPPLAPVIATPARNRRLRIAIAAAPLLAAAALFGFSQWTAPNPNAAAFQQFWQPVFRSPDPLLIAVPHPIVYHPSHRAAKLSQDGQPPDPLQLQRPIQVPPEQLNGSDIVPVMNQYVGFGDLVASTEIASMLAHRNKTVRVRMASGVEFVDLRRAQALLIGAFTNRWTLEFQKNWRFQFIRTPELAVVIADTADPKRQWSIPSKDDGSAPEDYMLLGRIRNSVTGGTLMIGAGLKQFGTEAAGRVLADPDQLGAILRKLPAGWDGHNLQIVLHAQVIGNTPAQPEVVAWHVW